MLAIKFNNGKYQQLTRDRDSTAESLIRHADDRVVVARNNEDFEKVSGRKKYVERGNGPGSEWQENRNRANIITTYNTLLHSYCW